MTYLISLSSILLQNIFFWGTYLITTQFNYKIGHVFSATLVAAVLVGCGGGAVDDAQQSSNQTAKGESRFLKSANANIDSNGILTLSAPTTSTTVSTASTTDTTSTSSGTAPAPTAPSTVTSPVTYDQLIGDMSLPHEGVVNGVNPAWDWGSFPKTGVGVNFPADYDNPAVDPWGIAGTDAAGSPATNVRVQIR
jgi:hypothetical protein